jgi:hypothetical protein
MSANRKIMDIVFSGDFDPWSGKGKKELRRMTHLGMYVMWRKQPPNKTSFGVIALPCVRGCSIVV